MSLKLSKSASFVQIKKKKKRKKFKIFKFKSLGFSKLLKFKAFTILHIFQISISQLKNIRNLNAPNFQHFKFKTLNFHRFISIYTLQISTRLQISAHWKSKFLNPPCCERLKIKASKFRSFGTFRH